uniref:Uncharacterized protein n=1 Tax=Anguilla anguilla TaxID=7936 RepID=A0A0E9Q3Q2_ANGAN
MLYTATGEQNVCRLEQVTTNTHTHKHMRACTHTCTYKNTCLHTLAQNTHTQKCTCVLNTLGLSNLSFGSLCV